MAHERPGSVQYELHSGGAVIFTVLDLARAVVGDLPLEVTSTSLLLTSAALGNRMYDASWASKAAAFGVMARLQAPGAVLVGLNRSLVVARIFTAAGTPAMSPPDDPAMRALMPPYLGLGKQDKLYFPNDDAARPGEASRWTMNNFRAFLRELPEYQLRVAAAVLGEVMGQHTTGNADEHVIVALAGMWASALSASYRYSCVTASTPLFFLFF